MQIRSYHNRQSGNLARKVRNAFPRLTALNILYSANVHIIHVLKCSMQKWVVVKPGLWTGLGDLETSSPESTFFHFSFFACNCFFLISKCDILNRVTILWASL